MSKSRSPSEPRLVSPPALSKAQKLQIVDAALARLKAQHPAPRTELYFRTPFQLLVSVVLSAQTTDKMVNRCMQPLYDAGAFTPQTVVDLGEAPFLSHIKSIGLAPTKARNVTKLASLLLERHGGEVPLEREALEELPGVGRKTANVVLAELTGAPTLAVDTHVLRVTRRLGLHREEQATAAEKALLTVVAPRYLPMAHHWFILHGRYTCKAQKPLCGTCVLRSLCPSLAENRGLYRPAGGAGKTPKSNLGAAKNRRSGNLSEPPRAARR
jgi:endonuclease-3